MVFACENNLYGASTRISKTLKLENIADRAAAYGMAGEVVDGNDVLAVNAAAERAFTRARTGGGPTLLELKTYRIGGHSRNDANHYRDKAEEKEWFAKDPIQRMRRYLLNGILTEDEIKMIEQKIENEIDEAVEYAKSLPDIEPEEALKDVFAGGGF